MLRRLEQKDAPLMLEWMHDETITCNFRYPFAKMTLEKAKNFIKYSFDEENQHFAITDDKDEYMGTISLKRISERDHNAVSRYSPSSVMVKPSAISSHRALLGQFILLLTARKKGRNRSSSGIIEII